MIISSNTYLINKQKIKYLLSSIIVTSVDYLVFIIAFKIVGLIIANILSYIVALNLSFNIQKRYIFKTDRNIKTAYVYIVLFAIVGVIISTTTLYGLNYFLNNVVLAKVILIILMFYYNFYSKKYAFNDKR
jgi:putative flippase GtrA